VRERFLTRLVARALVITVLAGGGLLIGGVADAAVPPIDPASLCSANLGTAAGASPTTTTLSVASASTSPAGFPVVLVAFVTPCAANGTVQFMDGDTNIGAPVETISGFAFTIASTLTAGTHSLVAKFVPAGAGFDSSASAPHSLTVTAPIISGPIISGPIVAGFPFLLGPFFGGQPGIRGGVPLAQFLQFFHGGNSVSPAIPDFGKLIELLVNGQPEPAGVAQILQLFFGGPVNLTR
jgi:hypothetical protein